MSITFESLTAKQLRKAASLREKIDALQKSLAALLGGTPAVAPKSSPRTAKAKPATKTPAKRKFSAATRAKMRRRAKERWAAIRAAGKNSL